MPPKDAKKNEFGRRIGESHPRAVLSDHEVGLLHDFLAERERLIERMTSEGRRQGDITSALHCARLSYRCLGAMFEVHWRYIGKIDKGERRCQTPKTS